MIYSPALRDRHAPPAQQEDMRQLRVLIAEMGGLAEAALARALAALQRHDHEAARTVIDGDRAIDAMEVRAGEMVAALIARRAPTGDDLREVLACYRIAGLIERVGDYAKTVAKRMPQADLTGDDLGGAAEPMRLIATLGAGVRELLRQALDAFSARDADAAVEVCARDRDVDALYNALFLALLGRMMKAPDDVPACSQLLFIAKSLERVGDQATNIAELVHYARQGDHLPDRHAARQGRGERQGASAG